MPSDKRKRREFHRGTGLRTVQRLDASDRWGRTKRYVSPLPIKGDDPDTQYRRCGICKVRGEDEYASYIARIPGRKNWSLLCSKHFREYGCSLGPETGQKLVINPAWAEQLTPDEKRRIRLHLAIKHKEDEARKPKKKK